MTRAQQVVLVALAAIVVAAAVLLLGTDEEEPSPAQTQTATGMSTEPPRRPKVTTIRIARGEPAGGVEKIRAEKGETVRLQIRSDTAGQVHVHGYDLFEDLSPGRTARLRFTANLEGIFEIELEGPHTPLATLRVEP